MSQMYDLPPMAANTLMLEWVQCLASAELGLENLHSTGEVSATARIVRDWRFEDDAGKGFRLVRPANDADWDLSIDPGVDEGAVHSIIRRAWDAVERRDTGSDICYESVLISPAPGIDVMWGVQLQRLLSDQVFIEGERRLWDRVILDFQPVATDGQDDLWAPDTRIGVRIFVPGPCAGPFTDKLADDFLEIARLVCSFAMGRPVNRESPVIFVARPEIVAEAEGKRYDQSILTLARDGISIDVFQEHLLIGGPEAGAKIRGSLVAYDAAIRQTNGDVATILLVAGMEALAVPQADWRRERAVTRFVYAGLTLCPEAADEIMNHDNFGSAFELKLRGGQEKRRKLLFDKVYDLRSVPVHSGPNMVGNPMAAAGQPVAQRVTLLSHLLLKMWLAYIQAPRSILIGHPDIAPRKAADSVDDVDVTLSAEAG